MSTRKSLSRERTNETRKVEGDCRTLDEKETRHGTRYLISVCGGEPRWVSVPGRDDEE